MFSGLHFTVFFLEASPLMKRKQAQNLLGIDIEPALNNEYKTKDGVRIHWIDDLIKSTYNDLPVIIIANEFLDAFPVYKFQRTPKGWKEILVDYNEKTKQLQYVMSMRPTIMSRLHEGVR
ncbi:unnamed protein product [Didymodactylos carnosus]|uniref:Protein arginine methyltransferase NDUFAF7 n=1 Tax=Didymodactylos carnosus TaxID=1234261 RepID=A0A8S2GDV3_9BILA|nr:unnamed protein product [Didymodactylos carnosus]CAF4524288.1 unnamed protein product [Didymodactylos carnosus]